MWDVNLLRPQQIEHSYSLKELFLCITLILMYGVISTLFKLRTCLNPGYLSEQVYAFPYNYIPAEVLCFLFISAVSLLSYLCFKSFCYQQL